MNAILGQKKRMSQTFVEGTRVPVTYIKAGPCVVTQVKSEEKDGYWSVQLGFGTKRIKNVTKPMQGHLKGAISELESKDKKDKKAPRFIKEIRFEKKPDFKVGDKIKVSEVFKKGDFISVTGTSKGKGFAGVVKRWGFAGGPRTHGQSDRERAPGSIGQGTDPGRVWKGKKMGGRMGGERKTIKNLQVVDIDTEENELVVSGPVPGPVNGLLIVKRISAGKLSDLIEETPKAEIVEGKPEEEEEESKEKEAKPKEEEKKEEQK